MLRRLLLVLAIVLFALPASAQVSPPAQGVAVLGTNGASDDAFALARVVYASSLRPRGLDEIRARVLGGSPAPPMATKDIKDLSDLRAAVVGDDAASRQLLVGIAKQTNVQAILVVTNRVRADADGGTAGTSAQARLFVAEQGDFDAARYEFDGSWQATVTSVSARFPSALPLPSPPAPTIVVGSALPRIPSEKHEDRPFYKSPWLWGAVAAAVLIGGIFFFASQDKSDDPIHVRMSVPR